MKRSGRGGVCKRQNRVCVRGLLIGALALSLWVGVCGGYYPSADVPAAMAAEATAQTDEYARNTLVRYINKTLNEQLVAALSESDGVKATIQDTQKAGYKSEVVFSLKTSRVSDLNGKDILNYVGEAIYTNPNLCILSTNISYVAATGRLKVYSLVQKDQYAASIRRYKSFLADLENLPKNAETMSDAEILLYLHDRVVQQAKYATETKDKSVYLPLTMADTGNVVCQSYAAVMNHLMRDMGFVSYAVESEKHVWNAVKLNGVWNYLDVTWDDPSGKYRDFVMHDYLLVNSTAFTDRHEPEEFDLLRFPGMTDKLGETPLMPKTAQIKTPMCYDGHAWYYALDGRVYRWDGTSESGQLLEAIPANQSRCVGEFNGTIYIGGSDGVYRYESASGLLTPIDQSLNVQGMLYYKQGLYYLSDRTWTRFEKADTPDATYEDLNGTDNQEVVELTVPESPEILTTKSSARSIRVSISEIAEGANKGYQIEVASDADFTDVIKRKTVSGTTGTVAKLTAGKTYYVRARGIWKSPSSILKKFGEWSDISTVSL